VVFNARVQSHVVPSADNTYDLGAAGQRWKDGWFRGNVNVGGNLAVSGTTVSLPNIPSGSTATEVLVWNAGNVERSSASGLISGFAWMLGGNNLTALGVQKLGTQSNHDLPIITNNVERLRVTATGDVVVQNQAGGTPTTVLRVLGGNGGAGATQVVLQAGTGQSGVNLLEWRDGTGQLIGVIDNAGFMGIGVNNAGFGGIAAYLHVYSNTAQPAAVFENGIVRIGNIGGSGVSAGPDLQGWDEPGATQVILQLGTAQTGVNLLEWQNAVGTVLGGIDGAGNLFVNTNTTLGDAAGDVVTVNAGTVALPNIPALSTATEVLVWNGGNVERRSAAGLISGFAWMLGGNTLTSEQTLGTLSAHDLPIITAGTEKVRITQAGDVGIGTSLPGARLHVVGTGRFDGQLTVTTGGAAITGNSTVTGTLTVSSNVSVGGNLAVTGDATVSGTTVSLPNIPSGSTATEVLVWNGGNVERRSAAGLISGFAWMLGGNDLTLLGEQKLGTQSNHDLPIITNNTEQMRITAAGDVGIGTSTPGARLDVVNPTGGGVLRLQAVLGQMGALLEWVDETGTPWGVIDNSGLVGIGTATPVQKLHVEGNGAVSAVFVEGGVGVGTVNPLATLHVYDEGTLTPGATQVIIQAGANQTGVNLLEWWDNAGTVLGGIDDAGNLFVNTNTTLGDAAGDVVTVNAGTVALPNIPSGSTATEVLVWNGGNVERRSAAGLAWLLMGNGGTNPAVNFLGTTDAQPLVIRTNNLERVRITATGDVGIGTNAPAATLDVVGTAQVSGNTSIGGSLTVAGDATVSGTTVSLPNIPSGSTATEVLVWNGGNVERRSAAGLISGFAWMLGGNDLTALGEQTLGTLSAHDLPIITAGTEKVRITQAGHVLPGADNAYDLGENTTPLRWRSGYFGTSVVVGTSVSLVAGTPDRLEYSGDGIVRTSGYLAVETGGAERLRVTATGDVVVQNQAAGTPTTVLRVLGGNGGAGATQVVLQAGTGQSGVNLLEWRDGTGQLIGVIDDAGFMGIGVNNAGFGGIAAYLHVYSNLAQPAAIFENGAVGIGTNAPAFGSTLHIYDARTAPGTGATKVIIQAGANQAGVNLLEWQDNTGLPVGFIDNAGNVAIGDVNNVLFPGAGAYLHVFSNTAQPAAIFQRGVVGIGTGAPAIGGPVLHVVGENPGAAARFEAGAGSTPLELQSVPTAAATDEVLRIDPATGEVKKSTVAAVISAGIIKGSFPIAASGSSFTISVPGIQPGAIVTVTLVGPSGGTIYPLMVTNVAAESITVESSATIPGGMGYAIHYIIINP